MCNEAAILGAGEYTKLSQARYIISQRKHTISWRYGIRQVHDINGCRICLVWKLLFIETFSIKKRTKGRGGTAL